MAVKSAIIKGTPYLSAVGVNAGESLGNTSKLTYTVTTEEKELPDFQNPGGGLDDAFDRFKSATVALSCRHVSVKTLELALGGTATAVLAGAVVDEVHNVVGLDKLIMLDNLPDLAVAPIVKAGTGSTVYVKDIDYTVKRVGIIPLSTGAIVAAADLKISYTKIKAQRVQALVNMIQENRLVFDGINERSNAPWAAVMHRVKFGPAKSVELIGDDFISFDIEGKLLAYDAITAVGKSQYMEMLVGSL